MLILDLRDLARILIRRTAHMLEREQLACLQLLPEPNFACCASTELRHEAATSERHASFEIRSTILFFHNLRTPHCGPSDQRRSATSISLI